MAVQRSSEVSQGASESVSVNTLWVPAPLCNKSLCTNITVMSSNDESETRSVDASVPLLGGFPEGTNLSEPFSQGFRL
jgi:hypothetical protein